ncbi:hypothetical protein [Hyphomonas sp.]|uniref:hypothetical protein n=1 Tax=Hyphomonas sp. TaxID=87 RepID=UPI0025C4318F|nr:hypothetical protein [Hyphomonas sp.]
MLPRKRRFTSGIGPVCSGITSGLQRGAVLTGLALAGGIALHAAADDGVKRSFANIEQISDVLARARLAQAGTDNQVKLVQDGQDLKIDAYVQGQMNRASAKENMIAQSGDGATAELRVVGDGNTFAIAQNAANGPGQNSASVSIDGDFNAADVRQTNDFGPTFSNTASLIQAGNGNSGTITQTVSPGTLAVGANMATITQTGNDNDALIEQTGADNSASIEQDGDGNRGAILQDGEGLSAILVQTGQALEYTINQTGCVVSSGCGAVSVTQTGP